MRLCRFLLAPLTLALASAGGRAEQPLARYVPAGDLVAYFQVDGLDAHQAAWTKTAAHAILNDTTTGAMLRSLLAQTFDAASNVGSPAPVDGPEFVALLDHVAAHGLALGVLGPLDDGGPSTVLVVRGAAAGAIKDPAERVVRSLIPPGTPTQILTRQDGRRLVVVRPGGEGRGWVFWSEGQDLVIVSGRDEFGADPVIAALEGKASSVAESPVLADLAKAEAGFEPVMIGWFDAAAIPPTPPALGLDRMTRVDYRAGFEGEALVSVTRLLAPAPRSGLLAMLDGATIDAQNFPPLPGDLTDYTVASVDPAKLYRIAAAIAHDSLPDADALIQNVEQALTQFTGVSFRDDLAGNLGPRWAFYLRPRTIRASLIPLGAAADWLFNLPPVVVLAEMKDPAKFAGTLDTLVKTVNPQMAGVGDPEGGMLRFEPLKPPAQGYRLVVPPRVLPLPTSIRPGLAIRGKYLAMTTNLDGLADASKSIAFPEGMPEGLVLLNVHDPRHLTPELIANLPFLVEAFARLVVEEFATGNPEQNPLARIGVDPDLIPDPEAIRAHLFPGTITLTSDAAGLTLRTHEAFPSLNPISAAPVAAALLLPAVSSARSAARRAQSTNNLKQIMLAFHNYHDVNGHFPPAAICDADGKPLLSWRVAILPFIEQQALYNEFHLDEPWDSDHNKPLSETVVQIYAPTEGDAPPTSTFYQALVGNGAALEPCEGSRLQEFTDGTSNTLVVVEGGKAVPWAKPDDIPFDPDKDLPKFGGLNFPGGFNAAFADGSVHFLKLTINPDTLKALITRAGGEVISFDEF